MSRRSQNRNQYESTTTGELVAGAFTVTVVSTAGLITDQDMYLVVEPDIPGQREWIKIVSITGNQLNIDNPNGRNLAGSDGDLTHPAGSKVRSVPTQQIFEDIFTDAEDDELALTQHETDGGDPHAQAGYLKVSETDPLYVNVSGDTMNSLAQIKVDTNPVVNDDLARKGYVDDEIDADIAAHTALPNAHHVAFVEADADLLYLKLSGGTLTGLLTLSGPPTLDLHAATKQYVDDSIGGTFDGSHTSLTGVSTSQHHVKYTDANAVSAMGTKTDSNDLNHDRYTDANAVSAMGSTSDSNTLRHNRYTDANAQSAIATQDLYYTKAEVDSLLANLIIPASRVSSGTFGSGSYTFPGAVGVAGAFNANTTVDFFNLPINAGGVALRLVSGTSVTRSS